MATRHKSGGDSKKLLTKTYSEIGVANNSQAETPTPSEKVEFAVKSSFWKCMYTLLHIFRRVLLWAGNQGNHQNFDPSLLKYKC